MEVVCGARGLAGEEVWGWGCRGSLSRCAFHYLIIGQGRGARRSDACYHRYNSGAHHGQSNV
jgi:hypothetical protein